jgi:hypothetical protein
MSTKVLIARRRASAAPSTRSPGSRKPHGRSGFWTHGNLRPYPAGLQVIAWRPPKAERKTLRARRGALIEGQERDVVQIRLPRT